MSRIKGFLIASLLVSGGASADVINGGGIYFEIPGTFKSFSAPPPYLTFHVSESGQYAATRKDVSGLTPKALLKQEAEQSAKEAPVVINKSAEYSISGRSAAVLAMTVGAEASAGIETLTFFVSSSQGGAVWIVSMSLKDKSELASAISNFTNTYKEEL